MPHRLRHPSQPQPGHQLPGQPSRGTALHHEVRGALRLLKRAVLRRASASPRPDAAPPVLRHSVPRAGLVAASYNVHRCIGVDKRFDPGRIAAVIEELDADIVALQEADRRFGHRAGLLELGDVERRTGLALVHVSPVPGGHGWRGNALLVRGGHATQVRRLSLPGAEPRGALIVDLAMPQGPLRVAAAHLGLLRRHRAMQAAAILSALEGLAPMPTLLLGDLNEWRSGTHSSLARLEPLFGPFLHPQQPSFPSRLPFLALDQIMGHPHGLVMPPQVHDTPLARMASDHLPLRAGIDMAFGQGAAAVPEAA
jgi:endonuclease/exonuclease/phosphatase family metal-dependent hydrolase